MILAGHCIENEVKKWLLYEGGPHKRGQLHYEPVGGERKEGEERGGREGGRGWRGEEVRGEDRERRKKRESRERRERRKRRERRESRERRKSRERRVRRRDLGGGSNVHPALPSRVPRKRVYPVAGEDRKCCCRPWRL